MDRKTCAAPAGSIGSGAGNGAVESGFHLRTLRALSDLLRDTMTDEKTELDPMTVLAGKQQDLEARLAKMSEALEKQMDMNAQLMKSNATLMAQLSAKPEPKPEEKGLTKEELRLKSQELAYDAMLRKLRIKQ